jgi:hypothetical protein
MLPAVLMHLVLTSTRTTRTPTRDAAGIYRSGPYLVGRIGYPPTEVEGLRRRTFRSDSRDRRFCGIRHVPPLGPPTYCWRWFAALDESHDNKGELW